MITYTVQNVNRILKFYDLIIVTVLQTGHVTLISPLPFGTLKVLRQVAHSKYRCVFLSLTLCLASVNCFLSLPIISIYLRFSAERLYMFLEKKRNIVYAKSRYESIISGSKNREEKSVTAITDTVKNRLKESIPLRPLINNANLFLMFLAFPNTPLCVLCLLVYKVISTKLRKNCK